MKQDKNIDKIIKQNLSPENPSAEFSSNIMQQINTLEEINEKALASLLKKHPLEKPSLNFTSKLMQEISAVSKVSVYQPVISKKVWFLIISTILLLVILAVFNFENTPSQLNYVDVVASKIDDLFSFQMPTLISSPILALSMFALSSLLFLDRFIRRHKHA